MTTPSAPKNIGAILFPGFQLLDLCGPLDILNILAAHTPLNLSLLAATLDPVSTRRDDQTSLGSVCAQSIVPTHTFDGAPDDLEVLIIPGGQGARAAENIDPVVDFVKAYYPRLKYVITVCTGSAILAKTGVLDGKRATSNKKAFGWVKAQNASVHWVPKARWVVDANIWTSSGISAGMDLFYAWVAEVWGEEMAGLLADMGEYVRNKDAGEDVFAERWGTV